MNKTTSLTLLSLVFGVIAYVLFYDHIPGISVFLGTIALLASLYLGRDKTRKITWFAYLLCFFMLYLSASTALLAAPELLVLNIFGLLGLSALLTSELGPNPVTTWVVKQYFLVSITFPFLIIISALQSIKKLTAGRTNFFPASGNSRAVLRGLLLSLPLLVVFSLLFRSANPLFDSFLSNIFNFSPNLSIPGSLITTVLVAFMTLGLLGLINTEKEPSLAPASTEPKIAGLEGTTFTTALGALFVLFLIFQAGYMFGGQSNIGTAGYSYAEYLHRGFAETIIAAILTTLTLIIVEKSYGKLKQGNRLYLASLAAILVSSIAITLSTLYRMYLYEQAYGLSVLRLFVAIFSIWVFGVLLILAYKLYKHRTESFFVNSTIILGLIIWGLFLASNPHAQIAQNQLDRFRQGTELDMDYLLTLSPDAMPQLLEIKDELKDKELEKVEAMLRETKESQRNFQEWQSWNLSRARAKKLLKNF